MNPGTAFSWMIALPLLAAPIIYLVGRVSGRLSQNYNAVAPARWLAVLVLAATGILGYIAGRAVVAGEMVQWAVGGVVLSLDGVGLLLATVVIGLTFMVTLFSSSYMLGESGEEKYYALLVAMAGSMIGLGCATDLFNLWLWFEVMAVSSFMLVAFYRHLPAALEAGIKYLVQSAAGSALVLIGIALVLTRAGTLNLAEIHAAMATGDPSKAMLAAGALFIVGFGVKAALVPLHTWLPDAHSQAPSGISAMLSGVVIEAGLVALLRSLSCIPVVSLHSVGTLLMVVAALNMIIGNLMALRQTQVKRLLAYSSVSHIGYMMVGFGVMITYGTPDGAAGAFFHLITHAMMKGLAFLAAGALLYAFYLAKGEHGPLLVEDLDGAATRYPQLAFALSVAVLGLGGLPPLAGFMSKWQIFVGSAQAQSTGVWLLVVFAALNSVLSLAYYAPLVNRMYRHAPSPAVESGKKTTFTLQLPLALLTLGVALLGLWPIFSSPLTGPATASLLAAFGFR